MYIVMAYCMAEMLDRNTVWQMFESKSGKEKLG